VQPEAVIARGRSSLRPWRKVARSFVSASVAGASLCALLSAVASAAPTLTVTVDAAQNVTISGSSDSLRAAIEEICARAGVELRAFEAADRSFAADYGRVPLSEVLARLLRTEAFIAGMRPDPSGGRARVAWLRVSGSNGSVAAPKSVSTPTVLPARAASGFDFGPNPRLVQTALTSKDPTARASARQVIIDALSEDPSPLQRFVQKDTEQVVNELVEFPHAAEFLRNLQTVTADPAERSQLQTILGQVQVRQAAD
jgi:hypothetical protein